MGQLGCILKNNVIMCQTNWLELIDGLMDLANNNL